MFNQSCAASMTGPQRPSATQISCFACGNIKCLSRWTTGVSKASAPSRRYPVHPADHAPLPVAPGRLANPGDRRPRLAAIADRAHAGAQQMPGTAHAEADGNRTRRPNRRGTGSTRPSAGAGRMTCSIAGDGWRCSATLVSAGRVSRRYTPKPLPARLSGTAPPDRETRHGPTARHQDRR
jgi:hypothetical protein